GLSARARFSPRSSQVSQSSSAGQIRPQTEQLRERLQRLRAQRETRLASNTPLTTAPIAAVAAPVPSDPVRQAVVEPVAQAQPILVGETFLPPPPALPPLPEVRTASTPLRPNVAAPELGLRAAASSAIDRGPVASSGQVRGYPTVPSPHQGYSTRARQLVPAITTANESLEVSTARLHGSPLGQPGVGLVATTHPAQSIPAPLPEAALALIPETSPSTVSARSALAVGSALAEPEPLETTHQSSVPAVTLTSQRDEAFASRTRLHRSQHTVQHESAIALPESLPLNPEPRLSPPSSTSVARLNFSTEATPAEAARLPEAETVTQPLEAQVPSSRHLGRQVPSIQTVENRAVEVHELQPQPPGPAFHHQTQQESLSLISQPEASPKDLPIAHCLTVGSLPVGSTAQTPAEADLQPARQRLAHPSISLDNSGEVALPMGDDLSKADSAAPCSDQSMAPALDDAGTLFPD
ncbi:MAG: hypothetical protein WBG38_18000, partial [Nodosilinea sp.]